MVLNTVKVLVIWRVVVTTDADGPEPRVSVATVASTVVLIDISSPVDTVLVASVQSDQVSVMLGVELAATSTGGPPCDMVDVVAAATGVLSLGLIDSQSPQLSVSVILEVVVSAATSLLVVVEVVILCSRGVVEVVVKASTGVSLLVVDEVQSDHVSSEDEDEVVTASTTGLELVIVVVELLVSVGIMEELVVAALTGVSLVLIEDVQSDQVGE
jgi:hypothetical protein